MSWRISGGVRWNTEAIPSVMTEVVENGLIGSSGRFAAFWMGLSHLRGSGSTHLANAPPNELVASVN